MSEFDPPITSQSTRDAPAAPADDSSQHPPTVRLGAYGSSPDVEYPKVGEEIAGYYLVAELGRGAQGRVFLARQIALAGRPVVVKFTPREGHEHFNLARLQHTAIVPLFGAEEVVERNLRLLCMPFLGAITLAELLNRVYSREGRSVAALQQILTSVQDRFAADLPRLGNADAVLGKSSYHEAICQIGIFLAEALDFAHQNGLVHLDIKPSNILLAPDGRPLLLDFHLARTPIKAGTRKVEGLGGTIFYMAPEHSDGFNAVTGERPIPTDIDQRCDIYSLGLVLYDALAGPRKDGAKVDPTQLPKLCPDVSPGLADILAKCIAERPADRYADAGALAEDLTQHVHHRPLLGVRNRSWRERWDKWRRRTPLALPVSTLIILATVTTIVAGAILLQRYEHQSLGAVVLLDQGQLLLKEEKFEDALAAFRRGQDALPWLGNAETRAALARETQRAEYLHRAHELHTCVDGLRYFSLVDPPPRQILLGFAVAGDNVQGVLDGLPAPADLPLEVVERTRADMRDLALLRAEYAGLLGLKPKAEPAPRLDAPRTVWDHAALARTHLRQADAAKTDEERRRAFAEAERELGTALRLEPFHYLPRFYVGYLAFRKGSYAEGASAFSFCIGQETDASKGLRPRASSACVLYFRARCYASQGKTQLALGDLDLSTTIAASFGQAYFERGLLHSFKKDTVHARGDLRRAIALGADINAARCEIARMAIAERNVAEAKSLLQEVLREKPAHPLANELIKGITE